MNEGAARARPRLTVGADVAIKLFDINLSSPAEGRFRFVQEASAASRIDPAHVVRILDHGLTTGGRGFIVMERLLGKDLAQHLAHRGVLAPSEVVAIMTPACAGLEAGHALGIAHGNIEPENVFLHEAGDSVVVKLLNFGMPGNAGGEAPAADRRSDLYALAVVAYRCVAGRWPFQASPFHGAGRDGRPPPTPASTFNPAVSSALDAWFTAMLQDDPDTRICQSAGELGQTFAAACNDSTARPTTSLSPAAPRRTPPATSVNGPPGERHRKRPRLPGAICVVTASATLALWLRLRGEPNPGVEPAHTASPVAPPTAAPLAIHIHLSAMPPEATLTLDGERLSANPFSATRSAGSRLHRLRAEAPGYQTIERDISLSRDLRVELMLSPVAAPPSATSSPEQAPSEPVRGTLSNASTRAARRSALPLVGPALRAAKPEPARRKSPLSIDRTNPWQKP